MELVVSKLALDRHLSHLVRGRPSAEGNGNEFLLIQDPTQDLCGTNTNSQQCAQSHIRELEAMLMENGYQVRKIRGKNATRSRVLNALKSPSVVALYYFGHGYFPRNGDQGRLMLADGPVHATEIEELHSGIRFVFLNACEGAAAGRDWGLDRKHRSMGNAFARSGATTSVIAPLWPVVTNQAAQAALEFFRTALSGECLGVSLQHVRRQSLSRYEQGAPDISWMVYRYFGDPNRTLPHPKGNEVVTVTNTGPETKVFREGGKLDAGMFAFEVGDVLFRASKRRYLQRRSLVTTTDFLAGLIRVGDLTRFVFRQHGIDPDALYEEIVAMAEPPSTADSAEDDFLDADLPTDNESPQEGLEKLHRLLERWVHLDENQLAGRLRAVLVEAEELSKRWGGVGESGPISEQDVLEALTVGGHWVMELKAGLPSANSVRGLARRS